MKADELIKIAHKCGERSTDCERDCPLYEDCDCTVGLVKDLANLLTMALEDVPHNCGTCMHNGTKIRELPCSVCKPLDFNKWEWRGDAE
jgi:hypothetical protein